MRLSPPCHDSQKQLLALDIAGTVISTCYLFLLHGFRVRMCVDVSVSPSLSMGLHIRIVLPRKAINAYRATKSGVVDRGTHVTGRENLAQIEAFNQVEGLPKEEIFKVASHLLDSCTEYKVTYPFLACTSWTQVMLESTLLKSHALAPHQYPRPPATQTPYPRPWLLLGVGKNMWLALAQRLPSTSFDHPKPLERVLLGNRVSSTATSH